MRLAQAEQSAQELAPDQIALEMVDAASARDRKELSEVFTRLRLHGVGLSLDDFGSGHAPLAEIYRLPFNEIKIDRTLVADMVQSIAAAAVVKNIIELAHGLSMQVCAKGVETAETCTRLIEAGCDALQGVLIANPVPAPQVPETIAAISTSRLAPGAA